MDRMTSLRTQCGKFGAYSITSSARRPAWAEFRGRSVDKELRIYLLLHGEDGYAGRIRNSLLEQFQTF
jgi:hypothetical protein